MNNKLTSVSLLLVAFSIVLSACSTTEPEVENSGERKASFKIGSSSFTVTKPSLNTFDDNGNVTNTLTLKATDDSKIEFHFDGTSPNTYPLASFYDGYYKNASGKQFNSTSGELIVTKYSKDGATSKASGTFHFKAKTFTAPIDSVEITGDFTNASNEL